MLFKAPPENVLEWDLKGIQGTFRWINRLWSLVNTIVETKYEGSSFNVQSMTEEERKIVHVTQEAIDSVTFSADIER